MAEELPLPDGSPPGLGLGTSGLRLGPTIPEARFDDAPPWFRDYARAAGKLLNSGLAGKRCTTVVKKTIGAGVGQMQGLKLFSDMAERPRGDWYVILFGAHDLVFFETPMVDLQRPMWTWFTYVKASLKTAAADDAQAVSNLLQAALVNVRRDLRESGVEIEPSDDDLQPNWSIPMKMKRILAKLKACGHAMSEDKFDRWVDKGFFRKSPLSTRGNQILDLNLMPKGFAEALEPKP